MLDLIMPAMVDLLMYSALGFYTDMLYINWVDNCSYSLYSAICIFGVQNSMIVDFSMTEQCSLHVIQDRSPSFLVARSSFLFRPSRIQSCRSSRLHLLRTRPDRPTRTPLLHALSSSLSSSRQTREMPYFMPKH